MKSKLILVYTLIFILTATLLDAQEWKISSFTINNENYYPLYKLINILKISRSWDFYSGKFILKNKRNYLIFFIDEEKIYFNRELKLLKNPPIREEGIIYVPEEMLRFILSMADEEFKYEFIKNKKLNIEKERTPPIIAKRPITETTSHNLAKKLIQSETSKEIHTKNIINSSPDKIRVIIIDPGHGGDDPGAIGQLGLREKEVVLKVALKLKKILEKKLKNVKIVLTRSKDIFVPLKKRAQIANKYVNKNTAGIFISIHANASYNKKTTGYETFVLSPVASDDEARAVAAMENGIIDPLPKNESTVGRIITQLLSNEYIRESLKLAEFVQKGYKTYLPSNIPDRGIKKALFYVLEGTLMPAILTEIGFITNRKEEKLMRKDKYQWKIAQGMASGILKFINWYEANNGFIQ